MQVARLLKKKFREISDWPTVFANWMHDNIISIKFPKLLNGLLRHEKSFRNFNSQTGTQFKFRKNFENYLSHTLLLAAETEILGKSLKKVRRFVGFELVLISRIWTHARMNICTQKQLNCLRKEFFVPFQLATVSMRFVPLVISELRMWWS